MLGMEHGVLVMMAYGLKEYMQSGDYVKPFEAKEIADIVISHAAAAAIAAMAGGILPGVAALLACGIAVVSIWSMYYRIAKRIGIGFSIDTLKALASALISNLATQIGGILAFDLVLTFIPGASILAGGLMNFAVVYVAGIIYLKMLLNLFKAGVSPEGLSAEALKGAATQASTDVDMKAACEEAKSTFKEMRKSGDLNKAAGNGQAIE